MQDQKKEEWYPVEIAGYWLILDGPFFDDKDVLNSLNVGREAAERNARIAAAGLRMKSVLDKLVTWQEKYPPGRIYHYDDASRMERELTVIITEGMEVLGEITKSEKVK